MDMLSSAEIDDARLVDWRKLAQGFHARFLTTDFAAGARFATLVAGAGLDVGHHPTLTIAERHVDLKVASADAIYRDEHGHEHVVEWVTRQDVDLARRISAIAADLELTPDPDAVSVVELGLAATDASTIAPTWAALLTGDPASRGRGSIGDEIRDDSGRVPNLWFGGTHGAGQTQRLQVEVYVPANVACERIEAAIAAGGTIVDDSASPTLTVIADPEGNTGIICVAHPDPAA